MPQPDPNDLPLACDMNVFTPAERDHHVAIFHELQSAVLGREDLPDGLRLHLRPSGDTLKTLTEFVDGERRCCPFFDFTLRLRPQSSALWLDLTGPAGVREFLAGEFPARL